MITYVDFSLFESPAKVLVNTVNTVGVMGKGIAKEFKRIYPEMFQEYQHLCESNMLDVGDLWLYKTEHKWVLNFPTKKTWRKPSRIEYIEFGLRKFVQIYQDAKITSISFPLLGCGNGELNWKNDVKPVIEKYLKELPIQIFIHIVPTRSGLVPEHHHPRETKMWLRSQPQSLAFSEVWDDLVSVVGESKKFSTLDGKETFLATTFENDQNGIRFVADTEEFKVNKEQLLDLWQQIRDIGICIPQIMPSGLDLHSKFVLPLFAELPYLRTILQADKDKLKENSVGLLLRPMSAKQSGESGEQTVPQQLQLV